jgi:hypothetical protein
MAKTTATIACTISTKKATVTGTLALRETVAVTLTGTGTYGAADLVLGIVDNGTLLATIAQGGFTGTGPSSITGNLNLNTTEMVAFFSEDVGRTKRYPQLCIWDITNQALVVNDKIEVLNNPYSTDMDDPTAADPIGHGDYAPIENGVTNGDDHTHQNGDGADLSTYYVKRVTTGANFRIATDSLTIELKDVVLNTWHTLILANGSLGTGPAL